MKAIDMIGWIGLGLLMVAVMLEGQILRIVWFISAIGLFIYAMNRKDKVNMSVNAWMFLVNLYKVIF